MMVIVANTEVLLEVDSVLWDPEGVSHVGANNRHPLDTLGAGEPNIQTQELESLLRGLIMS